MRADEGGQQSEQQKPQPGKEEAEVVSGGMALMASPEAWARWLRPMRCSALRWPMTGSMAARVPKLALDLRRHVPLLARGVDPELVIGRGVVAAEGEIIVRAFDRDPIRGRHYGQRSCERRY